MRLGTHVWHVPVAVMGAAVAVAAVAVHRLEVLALGVPLPLGLALGVLATVAVAVVLRRIVVPSRLATSYAVGWLVVFALALQGRPEGDYLVAGDAVGYVLMLTAAGVLALGLLPGRRVVDSGSAGAAT
jgi:hypothetical protein